MAENSPLKGVVYVDITDIFDQSHSIYVVNETGFPLNKMPPSTDQDVIRRMCHDIGETLQGFIKAQEAKFIEFTNENMVCIVFNYNYVGFHVSILNERAVVGSYRSMVTADQNDDLPEIAAVKLTLDKTQYQRGIDS